MGAKILVTGLSNSGKTSLLKFLDETLVIAIDGKNYPFKQAHRNVEAFDNIRGFTQTIDDCLEKYIELKKKPPKTLAIDSVSRVSSIILDNCQKAYVNFDIWKNLDKEQREFTLYLEELLNTEELEGMNLVLVAHAIFDAESGKYMEVAKGNFAKIGAFLSTVDHAVFIEATKTKRVVHLRNPFYLSRTLLPIEVAPDKVDADIFNLQEYINKISETVKEVGAFSL
jgi:hypothetical protein